MRIYETTLVKKSETPSQIEFLSAAYHRGISKSNEKVRLYQNLKAGSLGEQFVVEALQTYGRKHWIVLQNVWEDYFGVYESDIILITYSAIYIFEVKNFEGLFEYKNSRCYINGHRIKENYIHQAEKAFLNLTDICRKINRSIPVRGAILFVGEHSEVLNPFRPKISYNALDLEKGKNEYIVKIAKATTL